MDNIKRLAEVLQQALTAATETSHDPSDEPGSPYIMYLAAFLDARDVRVGPFAHISWNKRGVMHIDVTGVAAIQNGDQDG